MNLTVVIVLYLVAGVLEAAGLITVVVDVVLSLREARRYLERPGADDGPVLRQLDVTSPGTTTTYRDLEGLVPRLLGLLRGRPRLRGLGAGSLLAGLVVGTVANIGSATR